MRSGDPKAPLKPDLCIIGAGAGGLSAAAGAVALGASVVLIEKADMGGDSLNHGCVPSKTLVAAARRAALVRDAGRFGIDAGDVTIDAAATLARVRDVIAGLARNDSQARFEALGVRVIRATARFTAPDTVEAGGIVVRARRFVVASGSTPVIPPIPGLDLVRYLTTDSIFDVTDLPKRPIIVGAGAAGLELAQAFCRLGSSVVVLDAASALASEDRELVGIALRRLGREGVVLHENVAIERVESLAGGVRVSLKGADDAAIEGSHLLVAAGRKARVEGLGLEAGGIAYDKAGITVGGGLRSRSNRRVFAVGDVAGGPQSTHVATYHAGLVLQAALLRLPVRVAPETLPRVVYTDPEIACVGLDEAEARRRHRRIRVLRWPFAENDRARIEGDVEGHVKVVTATNGAILGAGIVGAQAADLIVPWTLALARRMNVKDLAEIVVPYPTRAEASRRAAIGSFAPSLRNGWVRRMLGVLRRLG